MACGHCLAACPTGAIRVPAISPDSLLFNTFSVDTRWLPYGEPDTAELVRLMLSRRSCRSFSKTTVSRALLDDLIKIGTTAPSGTNSQRWVFTVAAARPEVVALGARMARYFNRLNRLAGNSLLRLFLRALGKNALDDYYRRYYQTIRNGLREWEEHGRDRLFHGAAALIIVGSRPGASCPQEDALLATQNILLAAHAMGLGTCLIGFAVAAIKGDRSIKRFLRIPDEEAVHAVIALGYPADSYHRVPGRKPPLIRYLKD